MLTYDDLASKNDAMSLILKEKEWDRMQRSNNATLDALGDLHVNNMEQNIKSGLWDKHGPMSYGLHGLGNGKAVIGIGAGPSYNLNSAVLKRVHDFNFCIDFDDQPFMFACSNHQWKNCMRQGIYPHFVVIVDAGDVLHDQLCEDIPPQAKNTILLTGLHSSPKMLNEWDGQGRPIQFYVPSYEKRQELFKSIANEDPSKFICEEGGNVLNMMWIISRKFLCSSVFMAVGNDLSFPIDTDYSIRSRSYYADGDYSSNKKNKRDEAKSKMACMGFCIEHNPIINQYVTNLEPFYTSWPLWNYKKYIETQVALCASNQPDKPFHYYNCSERGILGVVGSSNNTKEFNKKDNWMLMDSLFPKRWHTRRLETAVPQFLKARDLWKQQQENQEDREVILYDADRMVASHSQVKTDIARDAVLMS